MAPANRSDPPSDGRPASGMGASEGVRPVAPLGVAADWDEATVLECFRRHAPGLGAALRVRLVNEADVEDCLNRVLEKLWFQGGSVAPAARRAWLFVVARNEAAAVYRRAARQLPVHKARSARNDGVDEKIWVGDGALRHGEAWEDLIDEQPSPRDELLRREEWERLRLAAESLPPDQYEVVRCRFFEGLTFRQIADRFGIPLGTALSRAHAAILRLKRDLDR
ncbi:MAG: sigma-70 family RNA polymerase sigma factor [Planctomycetaceae bacterium]|nr:MAG: sigma-70 family RNA polymerase sigma factor [Planctomycetaceae bacterium]